MKLCYVLPLAAFFILVIALIAGLSHNPRELPSPLIGKPASVSRLTTLKSTVDPLMLRDLHGKVWMLSVWISWCTACRAKHTVLNTFAKQSAVLIYGLNYGDDTDAAHAWLKQMSDPYITSLAGVSDKTGIDCGVYGVPRTLVIDRAGVVHYRQVDPMTTESMERKIMPPLQQLEQKGGHA